MKKSCLFLENSLLLHRCGNMDKILYSDIILLSADLGYTQILEKNGKIYITKDTLSTFEKCLPACFFRINRGKIVNVLYCEKFRVINEKGILKLKNGQFLSIARRKKVLFKKWFLKYLIED